MNLISNAIKGLHPAYFAMVMATGITAIGSNLLGFTVIAHGLFYLNIVAYAVVLTLQLIRILLRMEIIQLCCNILP